MHAGVLYQYSIIQYKITMRNTYDQTLSRNSQDKFRSSNMIELSESSIGETAMSWRDRHAKVVNQTSQHLNVRQEGVYLSFKRCIGKIRYIIRATIFISFGLHITTGECGTVCERGQEVQTASKKHMTYKQAITTMHPNLLQS